MPNFNSLLRDNTPGKSSNTLLRTPLNLRSGSIRFDGNSGQHLQKIRRQSHQPGQPSTPNPSVWEDIVVDLNQRSHEQSALHQNDSQQKLLVVQSPERKNVARTKADHIDQNLANLQQLLIQRSDSCAKQQTPDIRILHQQSALTPRGSKTKKLQEYSNGA